MTSLRQTVPFRVRPSAGRRGSSQMGKSQDEQTKEKGHEEEEEEEEEAEEDDAEDEGDDDGRNEEGGASNSTGDVAPAIADARTRASLTIVIQPGTDNLRIGRATDPTPTVIPHCIARLWKGAGWTSCVNSGPAQDDAEARERDRELMEVERGMKRWSAPTRKGGSGSGDAAEEEILDVPPESLETDSTPPDGEPFYVGEEALRVSCAPREDGSAYVLRRPMRRGRLDVVGVSPEVVACDLQTIWEYAISKILGIPLKLLTNMPCVLVVPAHVCKFDVKTMVSTILGRMGFRSCAVLQDAVCTCFHANTLTACVVDIGEGKTSVSVVEDGLCIPCSSFFMGYGGCDIGRLLLWLLQPRGGNGEAVLSKLDEKQPVHTEAFKRLKERVVYLLSTQQEVMTRSDELRLGTPGKKDWTLHRLKMGSAACVAPMGLFVPRLFYPLDWKGAERKAWSDPEEVVDDDFILDMLQNRPGGGASAQDDRVTLREEHHLPELGTFPPPLHEAIRDCIAKVASMHERNEKDKDKEKAADKDKSDKGDKQDKGDKGDKAERGDKGDKAEKGDRSDKATIDKTVLHSRST